MHAGKVNDVEKSGGDEAVQPPASHRYALTARIKKDQLVRQIEDGFAK